MNPTAQLPLADIHLAEPIGIFPLAIGWYLLGALILCVVIGTAIWLIKRCRRKAYAAKAMRHLAAANANLQTINSTLKLTAIHYFPQQQIAGLSGAKWHNFLLESSNPKQRNAMQNLIAELKNQQFSTQQNPTDQALQAAQNWIANAWKFRPSTETKA